MDKSSFFEKNVAGIRFSGMPQYREEWINTFFQNLCMYSPRIYLGKFLIIWLKPLIYFDIFDCTLFTDLLENLILAPFESS